VLAAALAALTFARSTAADIDPDEHGRVLTLPAARGSHWVWVPDRVLRHSVLFDGDTGQMLASVDGTFSLSGPMMVVAPGRGEIYVVDAVYSRGVRGERHDWVTVYDATTLAVRGEVEIPPRSASVGHGVALATVVDDERFLVVFNQDPANSVSIVDLETRRFAGEILVAGCACVYPTGRREFGTLCGDGTALEVELDDTGGAARSSRSARFFDPVEDPLTEKGVRDGERWLFASFEGHLHEVDFTGDAPALKGRWSLFSDGDRTDAWRIGGVQHLALHRPSRRLYSVVHQGGAGSHKDPGTTIWVYDLGSKNRVQVIDTPTLLPAFLRPLLGIDAGGWSDWLLATALPNPGVHSIAVTQDDAPLLFARNSDIGVVAVLDATSGTHLRDITEAGVSGPVLLVHP
jgi:methylamine dehydrogenase heavy chain